MNNRSLKFKDIRPDDVITAFRYDTGSKYLIKVVKVVRASELFDKKWDRYIIGRILCELDILPPRRPLPTRWYNACFSSI